LVSAAFKAANGTNNSQPASRVFRMLFFMS
jgi:hypothetical protein